MRVYPPGNLDQDVIRRLFSETISNLPIERVIKMGVTAR